MKNIESATITITNETTGETVYSETCSNPVTLNIDLNGEKSGEYSIEIETDDIFLEGYFNYDILCTKYKRNRKALIE